MVAKAQARVPVQAPTFTRLIARLGASEVPATGEGLTAVLDQWIDWNRAVVLARALDLRPTQAEPEPEASIDPDHCLSLRQSLAEGIVSERGLAGLPEDPAALEFGAFRQYYLSTQRAIQAATGRLRGSLRDQVAARSPELAHLAAVDAVMEQILVPREYVLLGRVVTILESHFQRMRAAAIPPADADAESDHVRSPLGDAWLQSFRRDLQEVLLGELDLRFQPIHALCEALRTPPTVS